MRIFAIKKVLVTRNLVEPFIRPNFNLDSYGEFKRLKMRKDINTSRFIVAVFTLDVYRFVATSIEFVPQNP